MLRASRHRTARRAIRSVLALALVAAAGACRTTAPSTVIPYSQTDLVAGTGAVAAVEDTLTVNYTGYLYDVNSVGGKGPVFDTSVGGSPFTFVLDAANVIPGWVQGVPGMKEGGTRELILTPALGYGDNGVSGKLPGGATLIFDITLISVQPPQ